MVKIAIFNQKGGVCKTTTAVSLASVLVKDFRKKVLAVNCDDQITLHHYLLTYTNDVKKNNVKDLFDGKKVLDIATQVCIKTLKKTPVPINLFVIPSNKDIDFEGITNGKKAEVALDKSGFDYCIFDLPPHLSGISLAALSICDYVIVPAIPDTDSLIGFGDIVDTVTGIRNSGLNPKLAILGIVFNKVDSSHAVQKQIIEDAFAEMPKLCFETLIKDRSIMEQARYCGTPICYFSPKSDSALEYHDLAIEVKERIKQFNK